MKKETRRIFKIIIDAVVTITVAIIGVFAGATYKETTIKTDITQSGLVTFNNNENSSEIVNRIIDEWKNTINENGMLQSKIETLESKNADLNKQIYVLSEENETLEKKIEVQEQMNSNNQEITVEADQYLFDTDPYMSEHIYCYMRNNDRDTIFRTTAYYYETGYRMETVGEKYEKGMTVIPDSQEQASMWYNLNKKYSFLTGKIGFEDKNSDRVDQKYDIYIYLDDNLLGSITIYKGQGLEDFSYDVSNGEILRIVLEKPGEDKSSNPNINLIDWKLYR